MSVHLPAERALYLAALDAADPERVRASAHAAECSDCQRLLREGERMLVLVDRSEPAPLAITLELGARVRRAVLEPELRPARRRWQPPALLLGAFLSGLLIWLDSRLGSSVQVALGVNCTLFESGYALATCLAAALWSRSRGLQLDPWTGSVVGMAGALVGQLVLRTHCEAPHAALHLLASHLLGVVLGSALGALTGRSFGRAR